MSTNREPIGVIGTGYVGLVTAAGFAELGNDVYCIDIDAAKIEGLEQGVMPIWEPGLAELVERHRDRLHFSTDLADALEHARLLFVAVGTPPTYSGDADLSAVHAVVDAMPASDHHALVMKSTVPVGTGETIQRVFAEQGKGFRYVSCPEFLKEGSAIKDFLEPDRVVVGDEGDWAGDAVVELYAPLDAPLVRTDIKSAEMVKLASNAFLATKISFINEIANVCEETGADVVEVARGMGLDNRIGPKFLQAGIGFGGSCFPKDVTALKQLAGNSGYHFQLLNSVIEVNELQKRRVIAKLEKHLGRLVDKEIALLGLAFKPNTDDMREASSLVLSSRLQAAGAHVRAYDPVAEGEARKLIRGVRLRRVRRRRGRRAPTRSCSSPSGRSSPSSTSRAVARVDARQPARRRAQPVRPGGACAPPGLVYEGIGRGGRAELMQALILAGGEGTRLRPLTSTVPKPVVPLVDRPFIAFMLDWLRGARRRRRRDVLRAPGRRRARRARRRRVASACGCATSRSRARSGTGGALKFAEDLLDERFLMLNGDVLTDIDVTRAARGARGARARAATLALYPVEDPSAYGLVRLERRRVGARVRREAGAGPDRHQQHLRGRLRARAVGAVAAGARASRPRSSATSSRGWSATGSTATCSHGLLEGHRDARALPRGDLRHPRGHRSHRGRRAHGRDVRVRRGRRRRRRAGSSRPRWSRAAAGSARARGSAGARCSSTASTVGEGTTIESAVVMQGASIGAHCTLRGCIVAAGARIGDHCVIDGMSVIGEGVVLGADNVVSNGARLFPGVTLPDGALRF